MILIVDNGSIHVKKIAKHCRSHKIKTITLESYKDLHKALHHKIKGVILSGGPFLYDTEICFYKVALNFAAMLNFNVPVLGICFGHQTLVEGYGGRVKRMKKRIKKIETITLTKRGRLFKGLPKTFEMYEAHLDGGLHVPPHFEVVAESKSCAQEAMQHMKKHIYGVQFHPENSGEQGKILLDNFLRICKYKIKS